MRATCSRISPSAGSHCGDCCVCAPCARPGTAPLVLVPLWQVRARRPLEERQAFILAIALYILAKTAEVFDHTIQAWLQPLSGHTLKHLLAAAAAAVIVRTTFKR